MDGEKKTKEIEALPAEYIKAKKLYVLFSALLLATAIVGIELLKGSSGGFAYKIKSPDAAPFVIIVLMIYFLYRMLGEWSQIPLDRRNVKWTRRDFRVSHWIAGISIGYYLIQVLFDFQIVDRLKSLSNSREAGGGQALYLLIVSLVSLIGAMLFLMMSSIRNKWISLMKDMLPAPLQDVSVGTKIILLFSPILKALLGFSLYVLLLCTLPLVVTTGAEKNPIIFVVVTSLAILAGPGLYFMAKREIKHLRERMTRPIGKAMKIKVNEKEAQAVMHMLYTKGIRSPEQYTKVYPKIQSRELPYQELDEIMFPFSRHHADILGELIMAIVGLLDPTDGFTQKQNEEQNALALGILKKIDAEIDVITRRTLAKRNVNPADYIERMKSGNMII